MLRFGRSVSSSLISALSTDVYKRQTLLSGRNHLFSSVKYVPADYRVRVADDLMYQVELFLNALQKLNGVPNLLENNEKNMMKCILEY